MILIAILVVILAGLSGYLSVHISDRRLKPYLWNYVYPVVTVPLWIVLCGAGFGDDVSLTNFVYEVFALFIVSISIPWIRLLLSLFDNKVISVISFMLTIVPVFITFGMRALIPCLPE